MELTLRHVAVLCAIEDSGSIGRAATGLGLSQPALSAQLQRIERELGELVFLRRGDGVEVTPSGRRVLAHARAVTAAMRRLRGEGERPTRGASVRVGGFGPLLLALADRLIDRLAAQGLQNGRSSAGLVARADRSSRVLQSELEQDKVDYAVVREYPGFELPTAPSTRQWCLAPAEPVFVGMSRQHPLATHEEIGLAQLRHERWAVDPDDDSGENDLLHAVCAGHGFVPEPGLITSDNGVARGYVSSGRGVALFEARARQTDDLVVRPLRGDPITCRILLRWRPGAERMLPVSEVRHALSEVYAAAVSNSPVFRTRQQHRLPTGPRRRPG